LEAEQVVEVDVPPVALRPRRYRLALCTAAAALALFAVSLRAETPVRADVAAPEEKLGLLAAADAMAAGLTASAKVIEDARAVYPDVKARGAPWLLHRKS